MAEVRDRALSGVRILDLTWGIAGPLGVLLLAEQGAEVIKVEPPGGDPSRSHPSSHVWHRSRRSIMIDLKDPRGREVFLDLLGTADVLVEAFSPGTMDRLGLGYEALAPRFERLVYCSVPAYPPRHRLADRPGYDALVQASSGAQDQQPGWRDGPTFLHMPIPSMGAMFLVPMGIVAALIARRRTGRGQHVGTSLYQGVLAYTTMRWQWYENVEVPPRVDGPRRRDYGSHQATIVQCGDGHWVHAATMAGVTPTVTKEEILGLDPVDPLTLLTMSREEREAHRERELAAFRRFGRDDLVRRFREANLGIEPIVPLEEALSHPQLAANGSVVLVDDPELGPTRQVGSPLKLQATPGGVVGPRPRPGADTATLLGELGYAATRIATLVDAGVVQAAKEER